jgi:hypothetical protein
MVRLLWPVLRMASITVRVRPAVILNCRAPTENLAVYAVTFGEIG